MELTRKLREKGLSLVSETTEFSWSDKGRLALAMENKKRRRKSLSALR
jgi:hypothetical protein